MAQEQSIEDKELQDGIKLHYDKGGGDYECGNCDWATNDKAKAFQHNELYGHKFWVSLIKVSDGSANDG